VVEEGDFADLVAGAPISKIFLEVTQDGLRGTCAQIKLWCRSTTKHAGIRGLLHHNLVCARVGHAMLTASGEKKGGG